MLFEKKWPSRNFFHEFNFIFSLLFTAMQLHTIVLKIVFNEIQIKCSTNWKPSDIVATQAKTSTALSERMNEMKKKKNRRKWARKKFIIIMQNSKEKRKAIIILTFTVYAQHHTQSTKSKQTPFYTAKLYWRYLQAIVNEIMKHSFQM